MRSPRRRRLLAGAALTLLAVLGSAGPAAALPDNRAWEMVSPVDKNGGEVASPAEAGAGSFQAAAQGGAIAYASAASFGQAQGASPYSHYIATRTASGWSTENITPAQLSGAYEGAPYLDFSADLSRGLLLNPGRCPAADPCPEGFKLIEIAAGAPLAALSDDGEFAGASADLAQVFLAKGADFYLWAPPAAPVQLDEPPPGPPAVPAGATFLAVSADGSTVYYRIGSALYRRRLGTTTQIAIGTDLSDAVPETSGASADGARLFLTTDHKLLLADTNNDADVYQWETDGTGSCVKASGCLELISSGRSAGGATFAGASAGGGDAFFITDRSLVSGDPGAFDLYDARAGGGFPAPPAPILCQGDSCQPLPPEPIDPALSTLAAGPGNPPVRYTRQLRPCGQIARDARRLRRLSVRTARAARRAGDPRQAKRLRRRSAKLGKRGRRAAKSAARCRRSNRGSRR